MRLWPFALVLGGALGALWARHSLGRYYAHTPRAFGLCRKGPYRWMRHPMYVFTTIEWAGIALLIGWHALVMLVPLVLTQMSRADAEEEILMWTFPIAYTKYRKETWF